MAPTAMPNGAEATVSPVESQVEPAAPAGDSVEAEPAPVEFAPAPPPVVEPPSASAAAPELPVRKPVARTAPKKPLQAAPAPEKTDREKALDSAAVASTDPGAPPPSNGDVAGPTAPAPDLAPMVPPLSDSAETSAARTEGGAGPADSGRGAGTWIVLAALGLGILFVAGLTIRRRRDDELSIFDRSVPSPRATQPPLVHHS